MIGTDHLIVYTSLWFKVADLSGHQDTVWALCVSCQINNKTMKPASAPLTHVELSVEQSEKVAIDITSPFEHVT